MGCIFLCQLLSLQSGCDGSLRYGSAAGEGKQFSLSAWTRRNLPVSGDISREGMGSPDKEN